MVKVTSEITREAGRVEFGDQKSTAHWEIDYPANAAQMMGRFEGLTDWKLGQWEVIRFLRDDELEIECLGFITSITAHNDHFVVNVMLRELTGDGLSPQTG